MRSYPFYFVLGAIALLSLHGIRTLAQSAASTAATVQAAASTATAVAPQALNFRVAGSSVVDNTGASLGTVEALAIDPQSGQVKFALVSTDPNSRTIVTPVPWQLLQHRRDARAAGGIPGTFQQFAVPLSGDAFRRAPHILSQNMAQANDASWMNASYGYFAQIGAAGGVGAAVETQTGAQSAAPNQNAAATTPTLTTNGINNSFTPSNAAATLPQTGTNAGAILPGSVPPNGTAQPALPPGSAPIPPEGSAPNVAPGNPPSAAPPRILLTPSRPVAPVRR